MQRHPGLSLSAKNIKVDKNYVDLISGKAEAIDRASLDFPQRAGLTNRAMHFAFPDTAGKRRRSTDRHSSACQTLTR